MIIAQALIYEIEINYLKTSSAFKDALVSDKTFQNE